MSLFEIRDVRPENIDEVFELEKRCFSRPWTREALFRQMRDKNCDFLAAIDSGEVLGYIGMMSVLDEGYISNVAVAPEHRRQGVADALIDCLVSRRASDLSFITLEVRASNVPAISLYEKHGFSAVGRRKNYYDDPKEDAVLMTVFFKTEA